MSINWYPGHMRKTQRLLADSIPLVDLVIELLDARIPRSSRNHDIQATLAKRPRVVVFTKVDLAEPSITAKWEAEIRNAGYATCRMRADTGEGLNELRSAAQQAFAAKLIELERKGRREREIRAMVVGIPNVGKSSLINRLAVRKGTQIGDRPGVTRTKQWIETGVGFLLLDTPGILWPKIEERATGMKLAVTGAISDDVFAMPEVAAWLLEWLWKHHPETVRERYGLTGLSEEVVEDIELIGRNRGCLVSGGRVDIEKASFAIVRDFRSGKLGRISLDIPRAKEQPVS